MKMIRYQRKGVSIEIGRQVFIVFIEKIKIVLFLVEDLFTIVATIENMIELIFHKREMIV
jgi:hypothetical protein